MRTNMRIERGGRSTTARSSPSDRISWTRKTSVDNGSFIYGQSADSLVEAVAGTCVLLSRTVLTPDDTKRPNKDSK
jgi:hypothetical protein